MSNGGDYVLGIQFFRLVSWPLVPRVRLSFSDRKILVVKKLSSVKSHWNSLSTTVCSALFTYATFWDFRRSQTRLTVIACHCPLRFVGMFASLRYSATRWYDLPLFRWWRMTSMAFCSLSLATNSPSIASSPNAGDQPHYPNQPPLHRR